MDMLDTTLPLNDYDEVTLEHDVFSAAARQINLADVLKTAMAKLTGTVLRDARSAFAALTRAGVDLSHVAATPADVRDVLASLSPRQFGASEKRLANIRSLVVRAVEQFGQRRVWITKEITLGAEWDLLFARIPEREHRWALSRLACFCTVKGIAPDAVTIDTLRDLNAALEAEVMIKQPRSLLKHTIAVWNMCTKRVPGWPATILASPFKTAPAMLPLEAFTPSFQADVAAWEERMRNPDPLDPTAPVRALRELTLQGYRFTFRRIASALVRTGTVSVEDVSDLGSLFEGERFAIGLRPYMPPKGSERTTDYAHKMATQLLVVARVHLGFDEERVRKLKAITDRIKPRGGRVMGERNRRRLDQFDDEAVVRRLLRFPEDELGRALKLTNPLRRAKGVERALAISLAIFTGLRVKNLRSLKLNENIRCSGTRMFIHIPEREAKTYRSLDLELPDETIALLDLFVGEHRGRLLGSESGYLFPSESSGPRSYSAMRTTLGRSVLKHAGITLSPHLYRHIVAKIAVERHPELAVDVSRRLGHASMRTTYASYLGTEGPASSRRINALLQGLRDDRRAAA